MPAVTIRAFSTLSCLHFVHFRKIMNTLPRTERSLRNGTASDVRRRQLQEGGDGCANATGLVTTYMADSHSYGNMFTILSKSDPIKILTVEFMTDLAADSEVKVFVYTMLAGYQGYETDTTAWTLVANVTVTASRNGTSIIVPTTDFSPIQMQSNELRSLYITLSATDVLYANADLPIGEPFVSDTSLSINVGTSVLGSPFSSMISESAIFAGRLHYSHVIDCDEMLLNTIANYSFVVGHDVATLSSAVVSEINEIVNSTMITLSLSDPILTGYKRDYMLMLEQTESEEQASFSLNNSVVDCVQSSTHSCTAVVTSVTVKHMPSLTSGDIRYQLLWYSEQLLTNLNRGALSVIYTGSLPIDTRLIITLRGVPAGALMNELQKSLFEAVTLDFLVVQVTGMESLLVLGANVTKQTPAGASGLSPSLQPIGASIDVAMSVTGEYRPPTIVDFDQVVNDIFDLNMDGYLAVLVQKLQAPDNFGTSAGGDFFARVTDVSSRPDDSINEENNPTTSGKGDFALTTIVGLVIGVLAGFILLWFVNRCWRKRKAMADGEPSDHVSRVRSACGAMSKSDVTENTDSHSTYVNSSHVVQLGASAVSQCSQYGKVPPRTSLENSALRDESRARQDFQGRFSRTLRDPLPSITSGRDRSSDRREPRAYPHYDDPLRPSDPRNYDYSETLRTDRRVPITPPSFHGRQDASMDGRKNHGYPQFDESYIQKNSRPTAALSLDRHRQPRVGSRPSQQEQGYRSNPPTAVEERFHNLRASPSIEKYRRVDRDRQLSVSNGTPRDEQRQRTKAANKGSTYNAREVTRPKSRNAIPSELKCSPNSAPTVSESASSKVNVGPTRLSPPIIDDRRTNIPLQIRTGDRNCRPPWDESGAVDSRPDSPLTMCTMDTNLKSSKCFAVTNTKEVNTAGSRDYYDQEFRYETTNEPVFTSNPMAEWERQESQDDSGSELPEMLQPASAELIAGPTLRSPEIEDRRANIPLQIRTGDPSCQPLRNQSLVNDWASGSQSVLTMSTLDTDLQELSASRLLRRSS